MKNTVSLENGRIPSPSTVDWIRVGDIKVDPAYQREIQPAHVSKIAKNFDLKRMDPLKVSWRNDGEFYVFDGLQRREALKLMGLEDAQVRCEVYEHLTREEEAQLFRMAQDARKALNPTERFKGRLFEGEPVALEIQKIFEETGFSLDLTNHGGSTRHGSIGCIGTIDSIHTRYKGDALRRTLEIIRDAWGGSTDGVTSDIISGITVFDSWYRDQYNRDILIDSLRRIMPSVLGESGKQRKNALGCRTHEGVLSIIVQTYNFKRSTQRIAAFESMIAARSRMRKK